MGVLTDFDLFLGSVLKHHVFRRWLGVVPTGVLGNKYFDSVGVCGVLLKKYSAQCVQNYHHAITLFLLEPC
jgi:hypothetical protein